MGFIACTQCKKFLRVPDNAPLNFDKCQNCGHTLEFASDEQELNLIMSGIQMPKIKYEKVCSKCNSVNPTETGMCLFCGSSDFQIQYNPESVQSYNQKILNNINYGNVNVEEESAKIRKFTLIIKIFAVIIGLIDFLFFFLLGFQFTIGLNSISEKMFMISNPHFLTVVLILIVSLLLSGLFVSFVLPRISYNESFKTASLIGTIVGIAYCYFSSNIIHILAVIILATLITGIGGLIGEMLIHKLSR